jgi:hypothetical protein
VAVRAGTLLPRPLIVALATVGLALFTPLCRVAFGPAVLLLAIVATILARS